MLDRNYKSTLYKCNIEWGNKRYSGMFLFKNLPDSSTRILFLSEVGLNLIDFEYKNGEFEVKKIKDFMNRRIIIKALMSDLDLLLHKPPDKTPLRKKPGKDEPILVRKKGCFKTYCYFYNSELKNIKLIYRSWFKKVEIDASYRHNDLQKVLLRHKRMDLRIELNLINIKCH